MEQEVMEAELVLPSYLNFKRIQIYDKYPKGQSRGRHWKHLKQIVQAENFQNYPPHQPNYVNIESPPSMHPCKRICDITGYEVFSLAKTLLRAMRTKSVTGGRRRSYSNTPSISPTIPLSFTAQDNPNVTLYDSDGDKPHSPLPDFVPDSIPDSEPFDLPDFNTCITCNELGESLLVCCQTDCPVIIHASCLASEPHFDDSGNFLCPYCYCKQTYKKTKELREKAILAKKVLSSFLDKDQTVRNDNEEDRQPIQPERVQPEQILPEPVQPEQVQAERVQPEQVQPEPVLPEVSDKDSVLGSSVSETNSLESNAISVKKGNANAKNKVTSEKKPVFQELKTGGGSGGGGGGGNRDEEEVTSSRRLKHRNQVTNKNLLSQRRRKLLWTPEEEKALEEGVLKFSTENHNIPWRKILEFGCRVFDKTRNPADLKDKWKKIASKEGRK